MKIRDNILARRPEAWPPPARKSTGKGRELPMPPPVHRVGSVGRFLLSLYSGSGGGVSPGEPDRPTLVRAAD